MVNNSDMFFFTTSMIYILISYNGPSSDTLRRA